jgi:hypothetical protein
MLMSNRAMELPGLGARLAIGAPAARVGASAPQLIAGPLGGWIPFLRREE